jgi:hypothetical protein
VDDNLDSAAEAAERFFAEFSPAPRARLVQLPLNFDSADAQ